MQTLEERQSYWAGKLSDAEAHAAARSTESHPNSVVCPYDLALQNIERIKRHRDADLSRFEVPEKDQANELLPPQSDVGSEDGRADPDPAGSADPPAGPDAGEVDPRDARIAELESQLAASPLPPLETPEQITEGVEKIVAATSEPKFDGKNGTSPNMGDVTDPQTFAGTMIDMRAMEMIAELAREIKAAKEADESYAGLRVRVHKSAIKWNHYLMMKLTDTLTEPQRLDFERDDKLSRQTDAAWASAVEYLETHD